MTRVSKKQANRSLKDQPSDGFRFVAVLLIGFVVAILIGKLIEFGSLRTVDVNKPQQINLFFGGLQFFIVPTYLSLCVAGCFGGLLQAMLTNGSVDRPSLAAPDHASLKPGVLGDCVVGIGGALIAFLALPDEMKVESSVYGILVFATGLVGGYGGKEILDRALKKLLKRIDEVDIKTLSLEARNREQTLENMANQQINAGLPPAELSLLQQKLSSNTVDRLIIDRIVARCREARRLGSRVNAYADSTNRVVPILEAICAGAPDNGSYHAQLGCAYRDCQPPRLVEAIRELDHAVEIQRQGGEGETWPTELDRLVARILKAEQDDEPKSQDAPSALTVASELTTLEARPGLKRLLEDYDVKRTDPIRQWLGDNLVWLSRERRGHVLIEQALTSQWISTERWQRVFPISPIKAIANTHLKRLPIPSSELNANQTVEVKSGRTFMVIKHNEAPANHWLVELGDQAGVWYIWREHWQLPWIAAAASVPGDHTPTSNAQMAFVSTVPSQTFSSSTPAPLTLPPSIPVEQALLTLKGSVGRNGANNPEDVVRVKQRFKSLGFDWFADGSKVDPGFVQVINLFQSIINGQTTLRGDGVIDVNGKTHQWLQAANAPAWIEMPVEGIGFVNYERKDTKDNHDYGTSWLSEVIIGAGKDFEADFRRGNRAITPIPINDVSVPEGGDTPDHSGHECGNACDIYLPTKRGQYGAYWTDDDYDRNTARAIIKALRGQPLVLKNRIFFNDQVLINEGLCNALGDHDHHIHFEVGVPQRVASSTLMNVTAQITNSREPTLRSEVVPAGAGSAAAGGIAYCYPPIEIGGRKFIVKFPAGHKQTTLTASDYEKAAAEFGLDVAVVRAVVEIESSGHGLLDEPPPSRPKILFEAQHFYDRTPQPVSRTRPDLATRTWNRSLYKGGIAEWGRLLDAMAFDPIPAMESASWGLGQVMGFNFKSAGCTSVRQMVEEAHHSEYMQLRHMLNFCKTNQLMAALKNKNWDDFARGYNGSGYRQNNYHVKLAQSYKKWSAQIL